MGSGSSRLTVPNEADVHVLTTSSIIFPIVTIPTPPVGSAGFPAVGIAIPNQNLNAGSSSKDAARDALDADTRLEIKL